MNHFLDLAERLSKTDVALEMDGVRMVVTCDNGKTLSIISNGYGCESGLLELMCISGVGWYYADPHGWLTADRAIELIQAYGGEEE